MLKFFKTLTAVLSLTLVTPALIVMPAAAAGKKAEAITLNDEQMGAVQQLNDYINSFKTMRGDFTQISPKGQSIRGVLMLEKPGMIRFDYAPPSPLLIVSDGRWLTIKNKDKEKGDQVPLRSTPLRLIVADKIDLLAETEVLGVEQADGVISVALADKKDRASGHIVLTYDSKLNVLQQWVIVDGKGRRTTVQFANLEKDVKLNRKLFKEGINRSGNGTN
jgi:outer membrane lipoprotein-sorting protein